MADSVDAKPLRSHIYDHHEREPGMSDVIRSPDVLVIGEALMDIIDSGNWAMEHVGGSPANVALGLGHLGMRVALLTQIARDPRGRAVADHLERSGVAVLEASFRGVATSVAVASVGREGQADYQFAFEWNQFTLPRIGPRVLHTGSLAAFVAPGASSVRKALEASSAPEITLDANIRSALLGSREEATRTFEHLARQCTVVKMSDEDAEWLFPGVGTEELVYRLLKWGPNLIVITQGSRGAVLANTEAIVNVAAVKTHAVDTIGAGDAFMAALIRFVHENGSSYLDRPALERAGGSAARSSAIVVSRVGADLPWLHELA